jgi:hypothetical protein
MKEKIRVRTRSCKFTVCLEFRHKKQKKYERDN